MGEQSIHAACVIVALVERRVCADTVIHEA